MKKLFHLLLIATALASAQRVQAFSYNPDNILLVFHDANTPILSGDVEYNLGSVSNLLNKTAGTKTTLFTDTNNAVLNNFGAYSAARVLLVAGDDPSGGSIGKSIWLSSVSAGPINYFGAGSSGFGSLSAKINAAGSAAGYNSTGNPYIPAGGATDANGFSKVVVGQGTFTSANVGTIGSSFGNQLRTDGINNGTLYLYQVAYSSSSVMTGQLVGTLLWDTNGVVTFTAGPLVVNPPLTPATNLQIVRSGSNTQISFASTNANRYQLLYTTSLAAPVTWQTNIAAGIVTGNNGTTNLSDTTTDANRFYLIQSIY